MISIRRSTVFVLIVFATALGVAGGWAASHVQVEKQPAQIRPIVPGEGARVIPAALPLGASGSFAQVVEAVGPAVVNINSFTRGGGARTPVEEFFGDEFFRRFFGDIPEREQLRGAAAKSNDTLRASQIARRRYGCRARARERARRIFSAGFASTAARRSPLPLQRVPAVRRLVLEARERGEPSGSYATFRDAGQDDGRIR